MKAIDNVSERKPHIFHFIGHGRLRDEQGQEVGQIALMRPNQRARWVDAESFSTLFDRHRPGIVLLMVRESGATSSSQAFVGVASEIVQHNIPVMVAMQYEVANYVAGTFSVEFYKRIAQGDPVDKAAQ